MDGPAGVDGCMSEHLTPEARLRQDLAIARRIAIDAGSGRDPSMQVILQVYEALSREKERGRFALPALDPMNAFIQDLAVDTARGTNLQRRLLALVKKRGKVERPLANAILETDAWTVFEQLGARCARLHIDSRSLIWTDRVLLFAGPALETSTIPWNARGARVAEKSAKRDADADDEGVPDDDDE